MEKHGENVSGIVFDIERFSVHDGPGIRTVVFLKGCPLRCAWYANPESQLPSPQMGFLESSCVNCSRCVEVCPYGEYFSSKGIPDFADCEGCLDCVAACLFHARLAYGTRMVANEVVNRVKEDLLFYRNSKGGVTLSGGEVSMQPEFAAEILKRCREQGIHTAVETCGYATWESLSQILEYADCLLYDLKHMDSTVHKKFTGVGNALILENAVLASKTVEEMIIRMPVIPGFILNTD